MFFAVFFIIGGVVSGVLAPAPLPLPDAPATDVVHYYEASRAAVLASGTLQVLSAVSLFVFVPCVAGLVRRTRSEGSVLPRLTLSGGVLAAALLLVSALLSLVLVPVVAGSNLALVGALRYLSFLTGGTLHVASLGLFVGAASIAARRAKALPRWILWLGIVAPALSLLSLSLSLSPRCCCSRPRSSSRSEGCSPSPGASPWASCWRSASGANPVMWVDLQGIPRNLNQEAATAREYAAELHLGLPLSSRGCSRERSRRSAGCSGRSAA